MRTVTYSVTSSIPVAMDRVFALLTDPAQMSQWIPSCRAASGPSPLTPGSHIKLQFEAREADLEVIELKRPVAFAWVERAPRRNWRTAFKLGFAGGATMLTIQQIWNPPSIAWWLKAKFLSKRNAPGQRNVRARLDTLVQDLRRAVSR